MLAQFEGSTAGWPAEYPMKRGGVRITGTYQHPSLAEAMPGIGFLFGTFIFVLLLVATANIILPLLSSLLLWVFFGAFRRRMVRMFGKKVDLRIFPDRVEVRSGRRYKKYSRAVPMEFRIEPHHKGIEETAREAAGGSKRVLYRQALEVIMYYGEVRVAFAEFRSVDIELARALLFRVQGTMQQMRESPVQFARKIEPISDFGHEPNIP